MIPNITKALVAGLKAAAPLTSIAGKIGTKLPDNFTAEKRLRIFRVDSAPVDRGTEAGHRPIIQIDVFGGTEDEANDLASTVHSVMKSFQGTKVGDVYFGEVELVAGPGWSPDPTTNIPRNIMRFGIVTRKRST